MPYLPHVLNNIYITRGIVIMLKAKQKVEKNQSTNKITGE